MAANDIATHAGNVVAETVGGIGSLAQKAQGSTGKIQQMIVRLPFFC